MNKTEQYNVILLGMVEATDKDPLMGDLSPWLPGSGLPDDQIVTDRLIGAMLRGGYSVMGCTVHLHAIDLTVNSARRPQSLSVEAPSMEVQSIADVLEREFPEFRATMIQVASPDQYCIGQSNPVGKDAVLAVQGLMKPAGDAPKAEAVKPAAATKKAADRPRRSK